MAAQRLWDDIKNGWNDYMGGGISWRKSQRDYKNTPANGPAAILAARLYMLNKDPQDLEWATRITVWLKDHLVDPASGIVWDGINREGDSQIDQKWLFTYNQGTYVGACVELWRATGNAVYLADAHRTATAALVLLTDSEGIFKEDGQGDGGLFKGILVRYLALLYQADQTATYIIESLQKNAASAWQVRTATGINGPRWKAPKAFGTIDLSTQLGAVMLYNSLAQLQSQ